LKKWTDKKPWEKETTSPELGETSQGWWRGKDRYWMEKKGMVKEESWCKGRQLLSFLCHPV
jgi:hypothetical protein